MQQDDLKQILFVIKNENPLNEASIQAISNLSSTEIEGIRVILSDSKEEELFWDTVLPYIPVCKLTDEILEYFITKQIAIDYLGHCNLSDFWLQKLSVAIEEAFFTLALRIYTEQKFSVKDLKNFLIQHNNLDMLKFLLMKDIVQYEKWLFLVYYIKNYISDTAIRFLADNFILSETISKTSDAEMISDTFKLNKHNPIVLLGISKNYFTPDHVLLEMQNISGIKYAKQIRFNSLQTLCFKKA